MTSIALGSVKGAPGVTTTALAMAAVWPASRPLLVAELDPDGGVLAARRGLGFEPGLLGLAAGLLRGSGGADTHTQPLGDHVRVVVAPSTAEQVRAAITAAGDGLWSALGAATSGDVLIDAGRLTASSPAVAVLRHAEHTLLLARPRLEDIALVRDRVGPLRRADIEPHLVLIDDGPYRTDEVAEAVGAPVAGRLPFDNRTADALNGVTAHSRIARSRLLRSVRQLVDRVIGPADIIIDTPIEPMSVNGA